MTEDSAPTQDVTALVERTLALAKIAPPLQSEDYWASIRLLRHGAEREVFAAAVELCRSEDAVSRAVGADTLGGIGYDASADSHRLADESEPVLIGLLSDDSPSVVMSAIFSLGHLRRGSTPELARVKAHPASPDSYVVRIRSLASRNRRRTSASSSEWPVAHSR